MSRKDLRNLVCKNGVWYVVLRVKGKKVWYRAGKSESEARKLRNELKYKNDLGKLSYAGKVTYEDFILHRWIPEYAKTQLKISTVEGYESILQNHILPVLGGIRLDKISHLDIRDYFTAKRKAALSEKTLLQHYRIIHQSLGYAVDSELIAINPASRVKPPKLEKFKPILPSVKQIMEMISALEGTNLYVPVMISLKTGLRRGEVLSLKWSNVSFDNTVFIINQSLFPSRQGLVYQAPKSEKSIRVVSFPDSLAEILEKHRQQQLENMSRFGKYYNNNDLVCAQEDGSPINPDSFSKRFGEFLKKNNLYSIRFHDLRHIHVTGLISVGTDLGTVQNQVGHAESKITLDYNHPGLEQQKKAVELFDSLLGNVPVEKR
jgi:integrase